MVEGRRKGEGSWRDWRRKKGWIGQTGWAGDQRSVEWRDGERRGERERESEREKLGGGLVRGWLGRCVAALTI